MLETAKEFESLGLTPIPVDVTKTNCKVMVNWQSEPQDVNGWESDFNKQSGIAIKLGSSSNHLICVDVDQKHDSTLTISDRILHALKVYMPDLWGEWYIERTRSGGLHIFFYLESSVRKHVPAKTIDANSEGELKEFALIEVLGEGQMVFTHPTNGYEVIQGEIEAIPEITKEQYKDLIELCASFNEMPEGEVEAQDFPYPEEVDPNDTRPGTLFNRNCDPDHFAQYLVQQGWSIHRKLGQKYWLTRPGKERGVSATWNHDGRRLFCIFSSSVELPTHKEDGSMKGYTPFNIYAHLSHEGNFTAAAAQLVEDGFVDPDQWDEVEPLSPTVSEPFNLDELLPPECSEFKEYVREVANSYQVHPEMVLLPCLSMVSLALCGAVKTKINEDWSEEAPLWSIVVAEASERKSPVLKEIMRPMDDYLAKFRKEHKRNIAALKRRKKAMMAKLMKMEKDYEKVVASGQEGLSEISAIAKLEEEIEEMPEMTDVPNLIQSDATPEALVQALKKNGEVSGVISSEADPIEVALGLYTDKPNFSVYLKGYSVERYVSTRVQTGEVVIEEPRIVVSVMMQREPMGKLASNRVARERGFLARCLFACPKSRVGHRDLEPASISGPKKAFWGRLIGRLMDMPHKNRLYDKGGNLAVYEDDVAEVELSPMAYKVHLEARGRNEAGLVAGGEFDDDSGWSGKLMGNVARLATVLHFLSGKSEKDPMSEEIMAYAVKWVDPLLEHYHDATGVVGNHSIDRRVYHAMKVLNGHEWEGGPVNDAFKLVRSKLHNKADDWKPVWDRMVELGFIRIQKGERKAKSGPAPMVMVCHPRFRDLV